MDRLSRNKKVKLDVDVDADKADAEIAALRTQVRGLGTDTKKSGQDALDGIHPLMDAISILGPALVPLSSGLLGLSSSAVGVGAVLTLAVKGATAAMQQGTQVGVGFAGIVGEGKAALSQLEATAASGVLKPFQDEVTQINRDLPNLNAFVAKLSGVTGDIVSKGADTAINLLMTAEPLISAAENDIDKMLTRLDTWAQGGGGTAFFNALATDMPLAANAIGNLVGAAGGILKSLEPLGQVILTGVDDASQLLEVLTKVPGLVTAMATAWVAYRIAAVTSAASTALLEKAGLSAAEATADETASMRANTLAALAEADAINLLAAAQERLAAASAIAGAEGAAGAAEGALGAAAGARGAAGAAEGEAGAATGTAEGAAEGAAGAGAMGALGGGLSTALTKILPAALIAALVGGVGAKLTSANSGNLANRAVHAGFNAVSDVISSPIKLIEGKNPFANIGSDISASNAVEQRQATQKFLNGQPPIPFSSYYSSAGGQYQQSQDALNTAATKSIGGMTDPSAIAQQNDTITASIQKREDAENALFNTSKGALTLNGDLTVSESAYNAEMAKTGNNLVATTEYFEGHKNAQIDDSEALQQLSDQNQRYNQYLAQVSTQYGVNSQTAGVYATALGLTYDQITKNNANEQISAKLIGAVNDAFNDGNTAMQGWLTTVSQTNLQTDTLNQRVTILGAGLTALQGIQNTQAGINLNAASAIEGTSNAIEANSKSVSKNGTLLGQLVQTGKGWEVEQPKLTAGSLAIQQSMAQASSSAVTLAQSIYQNTGSASKAYDAYEGLKTQFYDTEVQAGQTKTAAKNLADQVYGMGGKGATMFVKLLQEDNPSAAIASLTKALIGPGGLNGTIAKAFAELDHTTYFDPSFDNVLSKLEDLGGKSVTIPVKMAGPTTSSLAPGLVGASAGKGNKASGGFITAGTGPTADDVLIRASRNEFVVRASQATKYPDLLDAINRGTHGFASGGSVEPSLITSGSSGSGGSSSKAKASAASKKAKSALAALITLLEGDLPTEQLADFDSLASSGMTVVRNTLNNMISDLGQVKKAGDTSSASIREFSKGSTEVIANMTKANALATQLTKDQAKLANVQSVYSTAYGAATSGFDIGTSGNGYAPGILETLTTQTSDNTKFASLEKQAESLGLSKALIEQLASEGPTGAANLQAIVGGGKSYVSQLNSQYAKYTASATSIANLDTTLQYGTTQAALTTKIKDETTEQTKLQKSINTEIGKLRTEMTSLKNTLVKLSKQK
jgi:hypothetical protein